MPIPVTPKITDLVDRAIARNPGFTQGSVNVSRLNTALTNSVQRLEDTLDDLINKRALSTSEGLQLDNLGTILDLVRIPGQSDSDYAAALLGRSSALSARSGTAEQLISTYLLLTNADFIVSVDLFPATFELTAVGSLVDDGVPADLTIISAMDDAKPAGVLLILQLDNTPEFLWGAASDTDANGDLLPSINGFGDDADAGGNGDIAPGVGGGNFARNL